VVTVSVRDARSSQSDRLWIGSIYREYLDDLSALSTGIFPVLGEVGHREPDQVARWFGDRNAFPLVILKTAEPVGFAMVARANQPGPPVVDYRMAEFFISRDNRRLGVGKTAVNLILKRFAGRWEITEYLRNQNAVSFWRRVVAGYTSGSYQERVINGEVRQVFDSRIERSR
jgi:predicted acetyltransferase